MPKERTAMAISNANISDADLEKELQDYEELKKRASLAKAPETVMARYRFMTDVLRELLDRRKGVYGKV
jgi:hypothetical protein